jgi:hypothetical protein
MSFSFFLQSELKSYGGARLDENSVRKKESERERERSLRKLTHVID